MAIVNSKLLKRHLEDERREPAYSLAVDRDRTAAQKVRKGDHCPVEVWIGKYKLVIAGIRIKSYTVDLK